jgi:hypothetical protein
MKNITWIKSSEQDTNCIGIIKNGMIIQVEDKLAVGLEKSGFKITSTKPTHEKDKSGNWIEIKKSKKED